MTSAGHGPMTRRSAEGREFRGAGSGRALAAVARGFLAAAAITAAVSAQGGPGPVLLAAGADISGLRISGSGDGRCLTALLDGRIICVAASKEGPVLETARPVGDGAFVWDAVPMAGGLVSATVTGGGAEVRARSGPPLIAPIDRGLFTGRPESPPARMALLCGDGRVLLAPARERLAIFRRGDGVLEPRGDVRLDVRVVQDLRWTLGERATIEVAYPGVTIADADGDGREDLILVAGGRIDLAAGGDGNVFGPPVAAGQAGDDGEDGILGSDHRVGPFIGDVDGDGRTDVVTTDASRGSVEIFRMAGRPRADRSADQVVLVDGLIVWRWLADVSGDGRPDLVLLVLPRPGSLGLIQIVTRGIAGVWVHIHPVEADGRFAASPSLRRRIEIPLRISMINERKRVRFGAPLALLPGAAGGTARLLTVARHRLRLDTLEAADGADAGADLGPFDATTGFVEDPFTPLAVDLDLDGVADYPILLKDVKGGSDRLVLYRGR